MDGIDFGFQISDFGLGGPHESPIPNHPSAIPDGAGNETASASRLDERKKQLAKDFESILLTQLFNQVQESIGDLGFDEEDGTSAQVRGLFWSFLARDVADKGGFGLWQDIYQHFKQMEGVLDADVAFDEEL
jgi:hypothetical protein